MPSVGDVVLTRSKSQGPVSYFIQLGSKLRGHESPWTHAAIVYSATPGQELIVEALTSGVVSSPLSKYAEDERLVVSTDVPAFDRSEVVAFVDAVLAARWRYGFWTIAGLALYCLTGGSLCVQKAGTAICSGLVADALTRAGRIWPRPPYAMSPSDLAVALHA